jgi:hypothetical protein
MKHWICAFLLCLGLLTAAPATFARGEFPGPGPEVDVDAEFRAYCDRTLRGLERARQSASLAIQNGDFRGAVNLLIGGLRTHAGQRYGDLNPVVLRLIGHAFDLGTLLNQEVGRDVMVLKTTAIALERFYELIFDSAVRIDYRYYRCQSRRLGCRYSRTLEFERNVLEMVRDMLVLANSSLVIRRGHQLFPLGPASAYLTAAEVLAGAGYRELAELVYGSAYACEILELKDVWQDLAAFNDAGMGEPAKRQKLYEVYGSFDEISYQIEGGLSCR